MNRKGIAMWEARLIGSHLNFFQSIYKTLQELRMLSTVTLNCPVTMIVMNLSSLLLEL